jgi:hypothetical protein
LTIIRRRLLFSLSLPSPHLFSCDSCFSFCSTSIASVRIHSATSHRPQFPPFLMSSLNVLISSTSKPLFWPFRDNGVEERPWSWSYGSMTTTTHTKHLKCLGRTENNSVQGGGGAPKQYENVEEPSLSVVALRIDLAAVWSGFDLRIKHRRAPSSLFPMLFDETHFSTHRSRTPASSCFSRSDCSGLGQPPTLYVVHQRLRRRSFPPFLPFSPQPHASPHKGAPLPLSLASNKLSPTSAPLRTRQYSSKRPLHKPFFLLFLLSLLPSRRPSAGPACFFSSDSQTTKTTSYRLHCPFQCLLARPCPLQQHPHHPIILARQHFSAVVRSASYIHHHQNARGYHRRDDVIL